jgi:hypothetical protein
MTTTPSSSSSSTMNDNQMARQDRN